MLSLSKARLFRGAKFLNVGSGTGSMAIEAGFIVGDEGLCGREGFCDCL